MYVKLLSYRLRESAHRQGWRGYFYRLIKQWLRLKCDAWQSRSAIATSACKSTGESACSCACVPMHCYSLDNGHSRRAAKAIHPHKQASTRIHHWLLFKTILTFLTERTHTRLFFFTYPVVPATRSSNTGSERMFRYTTRPGGVCSAFMS